MGSQSLTNVAIVVTGIEELLLRSTMKYRYEVFRRLKGKEPLTGDEEKRKLKVWACQINVSVICEIVSILITAFAAIMMSKNALIINFGYKKLNPTTFEADIENCELF